jgi:DNA polymerase III epsilon subunit-like protein
MKKLNWSKSEINLCLKLFEKGLSRNKIAEVLNLKFDTDRTGSSVKHCVETYGTEVERPVEVQRVLVIDIESSPIISYTWGLHDQNVALNQIKQDWHILSWAAKWLGEDEVFYEDQREASNIEDESKILKKLWKLMDESTIILGQNVKSFDIKKINARFIHHGFTPPSPSKVIDTLTMARRSFGFTSNKLEYMSEKLCTKHKKGKHKEFSGFELWKECLKGNKKAWKELEEYNKLDVLSTEELYLKLRPWGGDINFSQANGEQEYKCNCGSTEFRKAGVRRTKTTTHQKYSCKICGSTHEEKISKAKKRD